MNNKVLIIEDEEAFRRLLRARFLRENFLVLTANNGKEGLRQALAERPDIIVLDLFLPQMSGVDFLENLRKDDWGKHVPVIVLTNIDQSELAKDISQWNVLDYRLKVKTSLNEIVQKAKQTITDMKPGQTRATLL